MRTVLKQRDVWSKMPSGRALTAADRALLAKALNRFAIGWCGAQLGPTTHRGR